MRVVSGLSGIVAGPRRAIAVSYGIVAWGVAVLAGCGQRGPLYLPSVPPLPERPAFIAQPASATAASSASSAMGASATPSPDPSQRGLRTAPNLSVPRSASDTAQPAR
ncbi:lipoprotein [Mycetohabitans sp. B5]|uniref:LPS translocon maturation chaperone LptM n=1 Tax=Mycetohabitans TaxID=2571159 RepID=UPI000CE4FC43|nr:MULTISPECIES: lipoprotein [Mycetohabitans]MCG1054161.1 lipoprotein [Mycetohabitans sp. B5]